MRFLCQLLCLSHALWQLRTFLKKGWRGRLCLWLGCVPAAGMSVPWSSMWFWYKSSKPIIWGSPFSLSLFPRAIWGRRIAAATFKFRLIRLVRGRAGKGRCSIHVLQYLSKTGTEWHLPIWLCFVWKAADERRVLLQSFHVCSFKKHLALPFLCTCREKSTPSWDSSIPGSLLNYLLRFCKVSEQSWHKTCGC